MQKSEIVKKYLNSFILKNQQLEAYYKQLIIGS